MLRVDEEKTLQQKRQKAKELVALFGEKFHGSITLHVAAGQPKKIEAKHVEDI